MIYEFRGYDGQIELYENKIIIRRKGIAHFSRGFTLGDKEIYLSSIQGIQVKKPGIQEGYIQFIVAGSPEIKGRGMKKVKRDENTVLFMQSVKGTDESGRLISNYDKALELKRLIEELKNDSPHENPNYNIGGFNVGSKPTSIAEELQTFKELYDSGVITEEELQEQKEQLLRGNVHKETKESTQSTSEPKSLAKKGKKRKGCLVFIVIVLAFSFILASMPNESSSNSGGNDTQVEQTEKQTDSVTMDDVRDWYEDQMPMVTQDLLEYAKSVDGISAMNISDSQFRLGEEDGWYDCHYTIYFTCQIDGEYCTGEARGFLKYKKENVKWFHFEIFRDSDWETMVEQYDSSIDDQLEEYYKKLKEKYGD